MRKALNRLAFAALMTAAAATFSTPAFAQVTATIVLKSGERHTGMNLGYRIDRGQVMVRENQQSEPSFPVDQVAYVDFGGSADLATTRSLMAASGGPHMVTLRDGGALRGQIIEMGHGDKSDLSSPFLVIIKTDAGDERRLSANQVARVYFSTQGTSAGDALTTGDAAVTTPPVTTGGIHVAGNQPWTSTRIQIKRNETLSFRASGEVGVGGGLPNASPAGAANVNGNNPISSANTGALIGRIGNNGRPFLIGTGTTLRASEAGELFLGINDSNHGDNQGAFGVEVTHGGTTTRTGRGAVR